MKLFIFLTFFVFNLFLIQQLVLAQPANCDYCNDGTWLNDNGYAWPSATYPTIEDATNQCLTDSLDCQVIPINSYSSWLIGIGIIVCLIIRKNLLFRKEFSIKTGQRIL